MSAEDDERDDDEAGGTEERSATGRKKRSDAGKPRGSSGGRKHVSTRFERRAQRVENTIRELVKLGKPDLDVEGLSFAQVVNRDVAAWGRFFAQLAEWVTPLGTAIDVAFGSPLVTVLNMLPSFRAARRDLAERRKRRQAERELEESEELDDDELRRRIEAEHAAHVEHVVEHPPEQELPLGVDPRAAWLGGNGGT